VFLIGGALALMFGHYKEDWGSCKPFGAAAVVCVAESLWQVWNGVRTENKSSILAFVAVRWLLVANKVPWLWKFTLDGADTSLLAIFVGWLSLSTIAYTIALVHLHRRFGWWVSVRLVVTTMPVRKAYEAYQVFLTSLHLDIFSVTMLLVLGITYSVEDIPATDSYSDQIRIGLPFLIVAVAAIRIALGYTGVKRGRAGLPFLIAFSVLSLLELLLDFFVMYYEKFIGELSAMHVWHWIGWGCLAVVCRVAVIYYSIHMYLLFRAGISFQAAGPDQSGRV